jgi:hypothetical protein
VFLRQSTRRLHLLALGYFDAQAGCDVFASTGPWTAVGTSNVPFTNVRFGDFNDDGLTDVFTTNGRQWSYAGPGFHEWRPLAALPGSVDARHDEAARVGERRVTITLGDACQSAKMLPQDVEVNLVTAA